MTRTEQEAADFILKNGDESKFWVIIGFVNKKDNKEETEGHEQQGEQGLEAENPSEELSAKLDPVPSAKCITTIHGFGEWNDITKQFMPALTNFF